MFTFIKKLFSSKNINQYSSKPHIVKFSNGKFGVRKFTFLGFQFVKFNYRSLGFYSWDDHNVFSEVDSIDIAETAIKRMNEDNEIGEKV